ncbi:MAG: glycosyltransferase [Aliidongia sp.]
MAGLHHARGAHVINMDDDLQNPPSEVAKLLEHAQRTDADVVYTYYAAKEHESWRNWGSRFTNWVADILLDKPRGLYLSSFRCMSAFLVEQILKYDGPFAYIDGLILQATQSVERIQVVHLPRGEGRSNYTLRRLVRLWLNMFLNFSVMPLRVADAGRRDFQRARRLRRHPGRDRGAVLRHAARLGLGHGGVLLLSGVQLSILGIAGEYLGRLFLTANRKPQFIVRQCERAEPGEQKLTKRA